MPNDLVVSSQHFQFVRFFALTITASALVAGCSQASEGAPEQSGNASGATAAGDPSATTSGGGEPAAGGGGTTPIADGGGGNGGNGNGWAGGGSDGGGGMNTGGAPPAGTTRVYAESPFTLYELDPITKVVTTIGDFAGCGDAWVLDIAVDKSGNMFGTTWDSLYTIDPLTAACTLVGHGNFPNSLSFVPEGTLLPFEEALVGYNGQTYVQIDTTTAAVTNIGTIAGSMEGDYYSSGDIVSVIGGGSFLTVGGDGCSDCLIEIDPTTGELVKLIGPLDHQSVFGLAYWGGVAYGFTWEGELFQIDVNTAETIDIAIPGASPDLVFGGAGSTTAAPHM